MNTKTPRVIRIIDERRLVLNVGELDGIRRGDEFAIYTPWEEFVDPKTKESLGNFRERKATVRASFVAQKYTVAAPKPEFSMSGMFGFPGALSTELTSPKLPVNRIDIQEARPPARPSDQATMPSCFDRPWPKSRRPRTRKREAGPTTRPNRIPMCRRNLPPATDRGAPQALRGK